MQNSNLANFPLYFWANPFVKSKSNERCDYNSELSGSHHLPLKHLWFSEKVTFWATLLKYDGFQSVSIAQFNMVIEILGWMVFGPFWLPAYVFGSRLIPEHVS